MQLTVEQASAFDVIIKWLKNGTSSKPYFVLSGFAGVGKGYLIKFLYEFLRSENKKVTINTLTWKAALVLKSRGVPASSIHSTFYSFKDEKSGKALDFREKYTSELIAAFGNLNLIIIDEASMVNNAMRNVILKHKIPVLFVGDCEQLPSIDNSSTNIMDNPDIILKTVQRQALDSPIIRLSMDIREGRNVPYGPYGDKVTKKRKCDIDDIPDNFLLKADMLICGKNNTRQELNTLIRDIKGFKRNSCPSTGERLVVLKNSPAYNLYNGMLLKIAHADSANIHVKKSRDHLFFYTKDLVPTTNNPDIQDLFLSELVFENESYLFDRALQHVAINEENKNLIATIKNNVVKKELLEGIPVVDFGYAMTLHKCQGSSFPKVFIYFEYMQGMDTNMKRRWLYTAVTRAEKALVLMQ